MYYTKKDRVAIRNTTNARVIMSGTIQVAEIDTSSSRFRSLVG